MIGNHSGMVPGAVLTGLDVHDNGVDRDRSPVLNVGKIDHVVSNKNGVFKQDDLDLFPNPVHSEDDCSNAGVGMEPILVGSLEQPKGSVNNKVLSSTRGIFLTWTFRNRWGLPHL
jgi:hypothetical protein